MKKFLLRADDLGYSEAVNYGIYKTVTDGLIRSVGLMPNMETATHGVRLLKDADIALGQHTNICLGKPLSNPSLIPSLVNEDGFFKSSSQYYSESGDLVVKEEAVLEIEAQYQRFVELTQREPDYFEGHAVFSKNFFAALEEVAIRHGLKYSGFSFDGKPIRIGQTDVHICFSINTMIEDYEPEKVLMEQVGQAFEDSVNLCVYHPGYLDEFLLKHSSLTINRTKEAAMLCNPVIRQWLQKQEIKLIDYRDL